MYINTGYIWAVTFHPVPRAMAVFLSRKKLMKGFSLIYQCKT